MTSKIFSSWCDFASYSFRSSFIASSTGGSVSGKQEPPGKSGDGFRIPGSRVCSSSAYA